MRKIDIDISGIINDIIRKKGSVIDDIGGAIENIVLFLNKIDKRYLYRYSWTSLKRIFNEVKLNRLYSEMVRFFDVAIISVIARS